MPRKIADFLIIVFFVIGICVSIHGICAADDQDGSKSPPVINEEQGLDSTQKIDHPPLVETVDSIAVPVNTLTGDSVILDPTLYQPGKDSKLLDLYQSDDTAVVSGRSPTLTMFKSVAFPGWGQFSNRKYVKTGLIFVFETYFIYKAIDYGQAASDWRTKWKEAPEELKSEYFDKYAENRDRRNTNLWYTALTIFLSMFDAYVDAHLQNFPANDQGAANLSLDISPDEESGLTLRYNF